MASIIPLMRRFSRPDECLSDEEIADDLARALPEPWVIMASLIEGDRDEADRRRTKATQECEHLETALVDLDTQYERQRAALVSELTEARQAKSAAAIWSEALRPGAVPGTRIRTATAAEIDPDGKFERAYAEVAGTTTGED